MKQTIALVLLILGSTSTFAGGGGGCPVPNSGDILVCHAQGASGNVVGMNVYHTNGCGGQQNTFAEISLIDHDLSYIFKVANGIDKTGEGVLGQHKLSNVFVNDPHEVIGFQSSGVFADLDTTVTLIAPKTYLIDGRLHVTRTKNKHVSGPDFAVHGTVVCE